MEKGEQQKGLPCDEKEIEEDVSRPGGSGI
jgi:hypothetical protein